MLLLIIVIAFVYIFSLTPSVLNGGLGNVLRMNAVPNKAAFCENEKTRKISIV